MTFTRTLFVTTLTSLCLHGNAQWIQEPEVPALPFDGGYSFVVNGQVYVGAENALYAFDPVAGTWTPRAAFAGEGTGRNWATAFVIGTTAYVGFGITDGNIFRTDMQAYDAVSNTWTPKASLPATARGGSSAFVVNGKAYICGGTSTGGTFSEVFRYDPVANAWSQVSTLPTGTRGFTAAFSIGNYGYVYGGYTGFGNETPELHRYDPAANTWAPMTSMPGQGRQSSVAVVVNGKAVVGMGHRGFMTGFTSFNTYDPASNTWTAAGSFPGGNRISPVASAVGTTVFMGAGSDLSTFTPNNDWWSNTGIVGLDEPDGAIGTLSIHPTPTTDRVTITAPNTENVVFTLFDISGAQVMTGRVSGGPSPLDVSALTPGMYTVRAMSTQGAVFQGRIIKQ